MQKFYANQKYLYNNGAIGWRNNSPFDCLGPFAKVQNCPIEGTTLRLTAYATGHADTFFSVPACTRIKGKYVGGYFTVRDNDCIVFVPYDRFIDRLYNKI